MALVIKRFQNFLVLAPGKRRLQDDANQLSEPLRRVGNITSQLLESRASKG